MKVLFMTGSHPRHAYMARQLEKSGVLAGLIIEAREDHVPAPPAELTPDLKDLFVQHFQKRETAESKFFQSSELPQQETLTVTRESLNSAQTHTFIKKINPDILLSYGVHKLTNETLSAANHEKWNIHGGLSPWYRGCITHFWPSYFLEPQMTGMTVHELTQDIDAGAVIHQTAAELVPNDGLHDLSCRAVMSLGEALPEFFKNIANLQEIKKVPHKTTGRIWTANDWRAEHLNVIYKQYNDRIVDEYLNGNLKNNPPKLIQQF